MNILITGATGMFGGALVNKLAQLDHHCTIKALVRNQKKAQQIGLDKINNIELVQGDMSDPENLNQIITSIDRIFLVSPMTPGLDELEINVMKVAQKHKVKQIFKLHGAVEHEGKDILSQQHQHALDYLYQSGINWTLISPNSVMETCLFPLADSIKELNTIYGASGEHKIGMVALDDVATVAALTITTPGHEQQDYKLTGPEPLNFHQIAQCFTKVLGRPITYIDCNEDELSKMIMEFSGKSSEQIDMEVMCHIRAWNRDKADLVTDTFTQLTQQQPTNLEQWININKQIFS